MFILFDGLRLTSLTSFMPKLIAFFILALLFGCTPSSRISRHVTTGLLKDSALLNTHLGIQIYDPEGQRILYNYQSDKYFVPASNTKIPTCYVALKYLPDSLISYFYETRNDTILIQPAGDPSFLHPDFSHHPSFEFLRTFSHIKVEDAYFRSFLGSGWSWNDHEESYMAQRSLLPIYGNLARFSWNKDSTVGVQPSKFRENILIDDPLKKGIWVRREWEKNIFSVWPGTAKSASLPFYPDMATILGLLQDTLKKSISSYAPMPSLASVKYSQLKDSMLKPMMHRSDNFFAEQVLVMASRQVTKSNLVSSIIDSLLKTDFKDLPNQPRWVDGSGLSRYNLFTPADMVVILDKMQKEFGMERLKQILPAGGEGTLSNYYKEYNSRFFAKTGTLSGVVALSGYMYTRKNRLLIFSVLVNNNQGGATAVRRAVERFLTGIMNME